MEYIGTTGTLSTRFAAMLIMSIYLLQPLLVAADDMARASRNFQMNCAVCHGPSGRPDPESPVVKALGMMPADFSDALFNSREPAADWELVIKHGGGALGFSDKMPAFGEQLTDEEIGELVTYLKTLAGEHDYPPGDLNLFLPLKTKKAFPEDEVVWKLRFTDDDNGRDEWKNTLEFEKRFGTRFQGVLELSHRFDGSDEKFNMFEPGGKYVLHYDSRRQFIVTLGGNIGFPLESGESVELLPYLAVGKILSDQFTFQGSSRAKLPIDDIDQGSIELSGIVHWTHTPRPRSIFPALEFTAEFPLDRGSGANRTDFVHTSLTPQARIGLSKRGHVAMNLGVEIPLNETDRFDYRGYMFLIWDFADGMFWEGW